MASSTIIPGGFTTMERNIRIKTVPCPLYDYMVLNKLCSLLEEKNREQLEYYSKRYSLEPHKLISILDGSSDTGNVIDFARNLLFERTTKHCTKLVELIKDPDNLVVLPTFFEKNMDTTRVHLSAFFSQTEIENEFKTVYSVLFQPAAAAPSQPQRGRLDIPTFPHILERVNSGCRNSVQIDRTNNVHFLPCIVKSGDKIIKTEKDYLEKLNNSIKILRAHIRDSHNVKKLVFLVDPDNKFSLQFYESKNIFSPSIDYLNKHLIAAVQKKDDTMYSRTYRYQFDDFIDNERVNEIYTLKGEQYSKELKNSRIRNSYVVKIHRIANDIIQWLFLGKKEPDYKSLHSEILKIFYNENIAKNTFNFVFNTTNVYTLHFSKSSDKLNFKINRLFHKQLKNKLKQTVNKKKKPSVTPLPSGYFLIDEEVKVDGQPTKYDDSNKLYIRLSRASFGGIIKGELFVRQDNIYKKPPSTLLDDRTGIVRMHRDDKQLVYYDASKIHRGLSKEYHDVRYFKNFLITKGAIKDYLKEQGSYKKDIALSLELAIIVSSQENMSDFYEYCSGHPKHIKTIKDNVQYVEKAINNILQILFERGTRLYINSKATSSNSNTTGAGGAREKDYHIQDFYKTEELYIPSANRNGGSDYETLRTKYNKQFRDASIDENAHSIAILDIYLSKSSPTASSDCKTVKQKILNSSAKILNTISKNISFKLRRFTT